MIFIAALWIIAEAADLFEAALELIVPDAWLEILRSALHGTGTPLIQALLFRFTEPTETAVATTFDILFTLFVARMSIRAVRRIRSWLP